MQQSLTIDKAPPVAALSDADSTAKTALKRVAMVAWLAIVLGFAMQTLVLIGKISTGATPALTQIAIDMAQGITWSFFVCAGVGIGTALARAHKAIGGLVGLVCAPLAMGLAKGSQKFMASALGASQKPAILSLTTLGTMRAIEYGILGWVLAWLVTRQDKRLGSFLLAGAAVGVVFGGGITGLTAYTAQANGIAFATPQLVATALNEILFPVGCAAVVCIALNVGRHLKIVTADAPR